MSSLICLTSFQFHSFAPWGGEVASTPLPAISSAFCSRSKCIGAYRAGLNPHIWRYKKSRNLKFDWNWRRFRRMMYDMSRWCVKLPAIASWIIIQTWTYDRRLSKHMPICLPIKSIKIFSILLPQFKIRIKLKRCGYERKNISMYTQRNVLPTCKNSAM